MDDISTLITSLLGEDGQLVEEAQTTIQTAIDGKVSELVEERAELIREELDAAHTTAMNTLLEKNTSDHVAKLQLLREDLDRKHYNKAKEMFDKLDATYAKKLNAVKDHYEGKLFTEQKAFASQLVASIDTFLVEEVVEGLIPTEQLEETAKVRHSQRLMNEMRELLGADEALKDDSIRSAIQDGGNTIKSQQAQIETLTEAKRALEVRSFLTESTKALPTSKANYVVEALGDKTLDFAQRNLSFIISEFERKDDDDRTNALLQEKQGDNQNNDRLIEESTEELPIKQTEPALSPMMSAWISKAKELA